MGAGFLIANLFGCQDLALFLPLLIWMATEGRKQGEDGDQIAESSWYAVVIMSILAIISARIAFGVGFLVSVDLCQHFYVDQLKVDANVVKDNFRSGWTNCALVGALLLTFAFPMAQVELTSVYDDPNIPVPALDHSSDKALRMAYPCACLVAIAFSSFSVLHPVFSLLYTDHLKPSDVLQVVLVHPWLIGNPIMCIFGAFMWLVIALCIWLRLAYGPHVFAFGVCVGIWIAWATYGVLYPLSAFDPKKDKPVQGTKTPFGRAVGQLMQQVRIEEDEVEETPIDAVLDDKAVRKTPSAYSGD